MTSSQSSAIPAQTGPGTVACPHCPDGRLDPAHPTDGVVGCPRCGHRAAHVHVAEQAWLEQQDAQLHARLDWVRQQVAAGDAAAGASPGAAAGAPAGAQPGNPYGGQLGGQGPAWPGGPAGPAGHRPVGVQGLLLGVGALCLVLAAIVFVAVAWDRLGALGQVGALLVVVGVLSGSAHALRQRYRSTAEALAAVAAAVAAVALVAAPQLGLGADWMRDRPATWAAVALAVVAMLSGVLAWLSRLVAWQVGLAGAVVASAFSAALALGGGSQVGPVGAAGLAVAATAVILLHPGRGTVLHRDAPLIGAGLGGLAVLSALAGYGSLDQAGGWALAWLVLAAGAAALLLPHPLTGTGTDEARPQVPSPWHGPAQLVAGAAAGQVLPLLAVAARPGLAVPTPVLALAGAALLAGALLPVLRIPAAAAALTCWLAAVPVLTDGPDGVQPQGALFLAIVAAALFGLASARWAVLLVWPAALVGSLAVWVELVDREVDTLEAYTVPAAGLFLLAGLLFSRVHRDGGSLVALGPALGFLALPSAVLAMLQAVDGEEPWRAAAVIGGGAVLAVLGAWQRVLAPLLVGLVAVTVAGLGQVWALAETVPRWIALAAAGSLLLAAGFSAERLARTGRHLWQQAHRLR